MSMSPDEDEGFDPESECPHCGAVHGYSEWEGADGLEEAVVCPSCDGVVEVDELYPPV